jgi:hypothetical protein
LSLRFNYSTVLFIEYKRDEEEFEEYDPDWVFLKVVYYEEGVTYDLSKTESIL